MASLARVIGELGPVAFNPNLLINPNFSINQREFAGGSLGVGVYGYDRWKAFTAGATLALSGTELTISGASGAIIQQVEAANLIDGEDYTISWEGTSQLYIEASGPYTSPKTFTYDNASMGDLTVLFGVGTLENPKLELGSSDTPFIPRKFSEELALCQRYYCKSYNQGVAPGTVTEVNAVWQRTPTSSASIFVTTEFPVPMRTTPTITMYSTGSGNSGKLWNDSTSADVTVSDIEQEGDVRFARIITSASVAGGNVIEFQFVADAEL